MLEYGKLILEKVSFDSGLFMKELRKLKRWMRKNVVSWISGAEVDFPSSFRNR
jgi:hypothetical protein